MVTLWRRARVGARGDGARGGTLGRRRASEREEGGEARQSDQHAATSSRAEPGRRRRGACRARTWPKNCGCLNPAGACGWGWTNPPYSWPLFAGARANPWGGAPPAGARGRAGVEDVVPMGLARGFFFPSRTTRDRPSARGGSRP